MDRTTPRAGDKALVLYSLCGLTGRIVDVLSDPILAHFSDVRSGRVCHALANHCEFDTAGLGLPPVGNRPKFIRTATLLRIPPDHELHEMFKDEETDKPKARPRHLPTTPELLAKLRD